MFCKECGTQLKEGTKFCANCGTKVSDIPVPEVAVEVVEAVEPVVPVEAVEANEPIVPVEAEEEPADMVAIPEPVEEEVVVMEAMPKTAEEPVVTAVAPTPDTLSAAAYTSGEFDDGRVYQDGQGMFRWNYEMNMWKNPTIIMTVWKVFMLSGSFPVLLVTIMSLVDDGLGKAFQTFLQMALIIYGIATVLVLIAYPIVAIINGGKYQVVFEMNEEGVKHIQMEKQFKKSQVMSSLAVLAGIFTLIGLVPKLALLTAVKPGMAEGEPVEILY